LDYVEFIRGIRFKAVRPMENLDVKFKIDSLDRLNKAQELLARIDVHQAVLPEDDATYRRRLAPIHNVRRMSTFPIAAIVQRTMRELPREAAYVNVGVWHGYTLFAGMLGNPEKRVVGVDDFSQFGGPREAFGRRFERLKSENHYFFDMDDREYLAARHEGPIGFFYYDGDHAYDRQLEALRLAERHFTPRCYVMVDDTNWPEPRKAALDFVAGSPHQYEVLLDQRTAWNGHPTFWNGLMVLQRQS
jgi:hypothetical protein